MRYVYANYAGLMSGAYYIKAESNCECEGECLRVCDSTLLSDDGCDGVAILVSKGGGV
jgi:hypothetical protein